MFYKLLFLLLLTSSSTAAQKQTYLVLAFCQTQINGICGEKLMIKQEEVMLLPAEVSSYRSTVSNNMKATYNKGYTNLFSDLAPASQAVILYEEKKIFTPEKDGWDCTSTKYGRVTGKDMLTAEKVFAALQAEYKDRTFQEVRRWGKTANQ